jgi:two-component system, OmpR family, alkaline phosphatase synthesis response regulator PhoP
MKILLAEDDHFTREGLADIFEQEGYSVTTAGDGAAAIELFRALRPDVVVLDIMMPEISGYDVCRMIRKEDKQVPVIFLSAKSEEIDKVLGLEIGADDYISKPFGVREVVARIRAVTRRIIDAAPSRIYTDPFLLADLTVFPAELRAVREGAEIDLSLRDVKILALFARNRGKVLTRDEIYNAGWGFSHMPNSRTLDQHISQLRKKVEPDPKRPRIITTVHSAGYRYL